MTNLSNDDASDRRAAHGLHGLDSSLEERETFLRSASGAESSSRVLPGRRSSFEERETSVPNVSDTDGSLHEARSFTGTGGSEILAPKSSPPARISSTTLHRSGSILILLFIYAALAIVSWAILCLLAKKPLTAHHYGVDIDNRHNNGYGSVSYRIIHSLYVKSENYFRGMRVIQAIVSVLTIPVTSAVCSKAAVVFVQQRRQQQGFTMRQLMTLADKGWTDPEVVSRCFADWGRYGSSFLLLAILLNLLGAIIVPIQQHFLTTKTIQTPTWPGMLMGLTDTFDFFDSSALSVDDNFVTILTRSALTGTTTSDYQPRLWTDSWSCNMFDRKNPDRELPLRCGLGGGITLGNISTLPNPWLAQLPSSYSTGLIKQFLPRFNSTVTRERVKPEDMPSDCGSLPGAFYAGYSKLGAVHYLGWAGSGNWSIEICMPANQTSTPWKSTRLRQDFTEELYLNISIVGYEFYDPSDPRSEGGLFKITSLTTGGFFELPNYMNDQKAGPLLAGDPSDYCGLDCEVQGSLDSASIYDHNITIRSVNDTGGVNITGGNHNKSYTTKSLDSVINKGPLLTVTLALFGDNSFIPARLAHPDAYVYGLSFWRATVATTCVEQAPLMSLLRGPENYPDTSNPIDTCITNSARSRADVDSEIAEWIHALYYSSFDVLDGDDGYGGERIVNAFASAVFLATEQWLLNPNPLGGSLTVSYDLGADTQIPVISQAGVIIVSLMLAFDITCLFAMAIYSAIAPRWTNQFDSFAMMRIGATMSDRVPLHIADKPDQVKVLDEMSGFIGEMTPSKPERHEKGRYIGELGLGATIPLKRGTKYRSYPDETPPLPGRPVAARR